MGSGKMASAPEVNGKLSDSKSKTDAKKTLLEQPESKAEKQVGHLADQVEERGKAPAECSVQLAQASASAEQACGQGGFADWAGMFRDGRASEIQDRTATSSAPTDAGPISTTRRQKQ